MPGARRLREGPMRQLQGRLLRPALRLQPLQTRYDLYMVVDYVVDLNDSRSLCLLFAVLTFYFELFLKLQSLFLYCFLFVIIHAAAFLCRCCCRFVVFKRCCFLLSVC